MLLDSGICTIYRKRNNAPPGGKPVFVNEKVHEGWYGVLNFETAPARPTGKREEVRADLRIRILQNRSIANHDRVELAARDGSLEVYELTRAYHGYDEDSGELISDLSLEVTEP